MSDLSILIEHRMYCLDALERVTGPDPTDPIGRAALAMARHCLKYVAKLPELDKLHDELCALAPDSAKAGEANPALALGGNTLSHDTATTPGALAHA